MDADNLVPSIVTALKRRSTELVASLSPLAATPSRSRGRERPELEDGRDSYQIDRELDKDKLNKGQPITLEQLVESGRVIKAPPVFPVEGRLVIGGAGEPVTFSSPHFEEVLSTAAPSS